MRTTVMVFTRDLRVRDQPALAAACRDDHVVPLFVVDDDVLRHAGRAANRMHFLVDSLTDLDASLRKLGAALVVRRGRWVDEIARLAAQFDAHTVHLSADGSSFAQGRVDALRSVGTTQGFEIETHPGVTVVPAGDLVTGAGTTYQVFTPFYGRWLAAPWRAPVPVPKSVALPPGLESGPLPTLDDLTEYPASPEVMPGGESVGLARMRDWAAHHLAHYADIHNAVADDATSRCSAYLHFGCLSPLEVASLLRDRAGGEAFVRQLCWRDFFHQLLASRPELAWENVRDRGTPSGTADDAFDAWRAGRTGYPLVDAGMRQLHAEGFMHNRVRMVVASFLTKDLDVSWQLGARHFMEMLTDGDVANNQLNWQWVAGTGTDTNPHRVFNPIRQSERFDPDGAYVRRYVAELADVVAPSIHDPSDSERTRCGYPHKVVEHSHAVAAYKARLTASS